MCEAKGKKDVTDSKDNQISLTQLRAGQKGRIARIIGGRRLASKLEALAIREGEEIQKISGQWARSPVLMRHGHSQVALGFRMASRVLVRVTGESK